MSKPSGIAVKLSGESLQDPATCDAPGAPALKLYDESALNTVADQVAFGRRNNPEPMVLVMGGGNIWRGRNNTLQQAGVSDKAAHVAGMLATTINTVVFHDVLTAKGVANVAFGRLGGIVVNECREDASYDTALEACGNELINVRVALRSGQLALIGGGTAVTNGQTTDTAVTTYARDLELQRVVKGSPVGSVFSDNPDKVPDAERFARLPLVTALEKDLGVMDRSAMEMAYNHGLDIVVCHPDDLGIVLSGELPDDRGTLLTAR